MQEYADRGDATGWFDALYQQAAGDTDAVPWVEKTPNPNLVAWVEREGVAGAGRSALVVGSGLGDDAEYLARVGFDVVAFDVSPTAVAWSGRRFAESKVRYQVADLFQPPDEWAGRFDLVVEAYTLQALPPELRRAAAPRLAWWVSPGGTLLVISRGRDAADDPGPLPWPLTRDEIEGFGTFGLETVSIEDYVDDEDPPVRRFRAVFRSPKP
jgi:SAM-dependent methyltransferase